MIIYNLYINLTILFIGMSKYRHDLRRCCDAVSNQSSPDAVDKTGWPILLYAVFAGHPDCVESLLSMGANIEATNRRGCTSLHTAATQNSQDIVLIFVRNGANMNARSKVGENALGYAYARRNIDVVETLIENGADVNDRNPEGMSFLDKVEDVELRNRFQQLASDASLLDSKQPEEM